MTRFNYLPRPRGAAFPLRFTTVAIDNRIRGPLAALIGTLMLTALLSTVQLVRLQAAQRTAAAASMQLAAGQAAIAEFRTLQARVDSDSRLSARVDDIRRASLQHANQLTWIGNHLPAHVWLAVLRYEDGKYSLEGTSDRAAAVGAAMDALRDSNRPTVPQLVSLHDDEGASDTRVRYRLRLQTPP